MGGGGKKRLIGFYKFSCNKIGPSKKIHFLPKSPEFRKADFYLPDMQKRGVLVDS